MTRCSTPVFQPANSALINAAPTKSLVTVMPKVQSVARRRSKQVTRSTLRYTSNPINGSEPICNYQAGSTVVCGVSVFSARQWIHDSFSMQPNLSKYAPVRSRASRACRKLAFLAIPEVSTLCGVIGSQRFSTVASPWLLRKCTPGEPLHCFDRHILQYHHKPPISVSELHHSVHRKLDAEILDWRHRTELRAECITAISRQQVSVVPDNQ